jgi:Glycosyl transferases group 1
MRLLHLDSGLSMRGGQWQALRLAEGLSHAGHSVTLLARRGSPGLAMARTLGLDARPLTALAVRQLSRQADLTHAHDARSHTISALLSAAPLIVSRRVSFPIRGGLSGWKYARPRHFIAVSNYVKNVLIQAGVGSECISVVYDGVPLLAPSIHGPKIIAPASSDPQKGAAIALEAARLAGVSLHLSTDLEHDLRAAAMFVYITHSEGLGSAILLAMSAGVPVVASRVGGIPEIVEDGKSGLLAENSPPEIAAAILRLREDPELAQLLAARARQLIEERFSIPAMVDATTRVYERVLSC